MKSLTINQLEDFVATGNFWENLRDGINGGLFLICSGWSAISLLASLEVYTNPVTGVAATILNTGCYVGGLINGAIEEWGGE